MSVEIRSFGQLPDGQPVQCYILKNNRGTSVSVLDFGATIQALCFAGRDLVLGYDTIEEYLQRGGHLGATIGRFANRIDGGRFMLDGQEICLDCNEAARGNHLHGGKGGFDRRLWSTAVVSDGDAPAVRMSLISEDGEEGYPGRMEVSVTFTLDTEDTLELAYHAVTDKKTVVNLTNHSYFNLGGYDSGTVDTTLLQIPAEEFTAVNDRLIPTGEYLPVEGTPLDLRRARPLGQVFASADPLVTGVDGLDHNFVLAHDRRPLSEAAVAYCPQTGIRLTCLTDLPGIQIYTTNSMGDVRGKAGVPFVKHGAFCLETQLFPDSVHHTNFPSAVLNPGEVFATSTQFKLQKD